MINMSFSGRASHEEFLKIFTIAAAIFVFVGLILHVLYMALGLTLFSALLLLPVSVRRLHDRNKSGHYLTFLILFGVVAYFLVINKVPLGLSFYIFYFVSFSVYSGYLLKELFSQSVDEENIYGSSQGNLSQGTQDTSLSREPSTNSRYYYVLLVLGWVVFVPIAFISFFLFGFAGSDESGVIQLFLALLALLPFLAIMGFTYFMTSLISKERQKMPSDTTRTS